MNKVEDTDELEFLSTLGYAANGLYGADGKRLQKRWYRRFGGRIRLFNFVLITASVLAVGLLLWPEKQQEKQVPVVQPSENSEAIGEEVTTQVAAPVEEEPAQELFTRPLKKSHQLSRVNEQVEQVVQIENLTALPLPQLPVTNLKEEKLKYMINTPVFFIHDLKVSNYNVLYFRKNKFIPYTGISADRSTEFSNHLNQEPERYLHNLLDEALLHFKKGEYLPCVNLLNEVAEYTKDDVNSDFYRGMAWYHMKHYDKANNYLDRCVYAANNAFMQEAQFYQALCLKQLGRDAEAKKMLKKIVGEGEFYAEKANALLNN